MSLSPCLALMFEDNGDRSHKQVTGYVGTNLRSAPAMKHSQISTSIYLMKRCKKGGNKLMKLPDLTFQQLSSTVDSTPAFSPNKIVKEKKMSLFAEMAFLRFNC